MRDVVGSHQRLRDLLARDHLIKICGLRQPDHAAVAAAAGADLLGFIFAPARRHVTAAVARACVTAARRASRERAIMTVGVFVDAGSDEIREVVGEADLDAVQLHGGEPPDLLTTLPVPAIKALRPRAGESAPDVVAAIDRYRACARPPFIFLVDGYADGLAGGTGARADWGLAADVAAQRLILLGGGLDPANVAAAIRQVRPRGVDVSSGVELDGVKDPTRIEAFIRTARSAFLDQLPDRRA